MNIFKRLCGYEKMRKFDLAFDAAAFVDMRKGKANQCYLIGLLVRWVQFGKFFGVEFIFWSAC